MLAIPPPSPGLRSFLAWTIRLLGLYVIFGVQWAIWNAYATVPLEPAPSGISPAALKAMITAGILAMSAVTLWLSIKIYREDGLKAAREIEDWNIEGK